MILKSAGYDSQATYSAEEAAELVHALRPDLVIADVAMPGMSGIELCIWLHASDAELPVILLSGRAASDELLEHERERMGQEVAVLAKPCLPRDLLRAVDEMTRYKLPKAG